MPKPLSSDLRKRIVGAREKGISVKEICRNFDVRKNTVYSLRLNKESGGYEPRPSNSGRKPALSEEQLQQIKDSIESNPDIALEELKEELFLPVGISALCRTIHKKLGLVRKKRHRSQSGASVKT